MKPFPGEIGKVGRCHRKVLNDEQREWLCRWFPSIENKRLAKAMGISLNVLHSFARELALTKSEAGIKAIKKRRDKAAALTNERNGCYARKRGRRPSDATMEGNQRRWMEERLGLRENSQKRMQREDPERYRLWIERRSSERRETIRKEKLRVKYGIERKTRLISVVMCPFKPSQISHRHNALRHGYLLDEDCSEGSPGRYVIYYDDKTKRSERFEQNCIKDGFRFERDE